MAEYSKYPNQIDTTTELPKATDNVTLVKAELFNRLRDALLSIEQELGIQPSSTYSTVRDRLDSIEGRINDIGIEGPTGPAGAQGPQGLQGPQGEMGPQGPAGEGLDLTNGIEFPTAGTFSITQDEAPNGSFLVKSANIKAQSAAPILIEEEFLGINGGNLTLSGGDPSDATGYSGDVIVDLGRRAGFSLTDSESEFLRINRSGSETNIAGMNEIVLSTIADTTGRIEMRSQTGSQFAYMGMYTDSSINYLYFNAKRYDFTSGQRRGSVASVQAVGSTNVTLDFNIAEEWHIHLDGNVTMLLPLNVWNGTLYSVRTFQRLDGPGGRTVTWHSRFKFGSFDSSVTPTAGGRDYFIFKGDYSSQSLYCIQVVKNMDA